jgi:hypothetical protein
MQRRAGGIAGPALTDQRVELGAYQLVIAADQVDEGVRCPRRAPHLEHHLPWGRIVSI